MSKKKDEQAKEFESMKGMTLQQLILDKAKEKYLIVPLAAEWAKELKKTEEFRHMTQNEILDMSLVDVITGKVTWEKLKARAAVVLEAAAALEEAPKKAKKED